MIGARIPAIAAFSLFLWVEAAICALPDPATGGKGGGPIDLLLIKGHSEWAFGRQPVLDEKYQVMIRGRGYRVTVVEEWQELNAAYLKHFNTVVYLNPSAYLGGGYFDSTNWRSGWHLLTIRKNVEVLREYVRSGGGLFLIPAFEEIATRTTYTLNRLFRPYGLRTVCAVTRDNKNAFSAAKIGFCRALYCWTERIAEHPISEGVKRIYYPSYCTRWDDNYTTIPLRALDEAWTVVARAMPGSQSMMRRSSIYDPKGDWTPAEGWDEPAIVVAREYGKGRVVVTGISSWHLFYITYAKSGNVTESSFSRVDGIPMTEGDGETKSDLHLLLDSAYRWLAQASLKAGMGGYGPGTRSELPEVDHSRDQTHLSDMWADRDPMATGPIRPQRILVGGRSAVSSGKGSAQEWAQAAKKAGFDVICFTETFEHLKHDQWEQFVVDCESLSGSEVALVPGLDIDTDLGNRFLIVGHTSHMRPHLLTKDRKKLFWTGHMMLGMGDVLPIAARPQWLATVRGEQGALPPDLYSHLAGVAVATYAGGKQVDDGFFAYKWHVDNATVPYPVTVHEVSEPAALTVAARTGLHNYVNSDTPAHAAFYFRQGFGNYGGNPHRYYVSSGPLVDACTMDDWQSHHWNMNLKAHGEAPITEVLVRDQRNLYRRFTPNTKEISVSWSGHVGAQQWFITEVRDANGGKAYLSPVRTLPPFHYARCQDRQNFFGTRFVWLTYVGRMTQRMATVQVPGVKLAASVCPKPQMFYAGNRYTILDFVLDSTHVPGGQHYDPTKQEYVPGGRRYGADNAPLFNCRPIPEYWGRVRYTHYRLRDDRRLMGPPAHVDAEAHIRLKADLKAQGDVWPIIGKTGVNGSYSYTDAKTGKRVTGEVEGFVDLPEGGTVNDIVALSPLRVSAAGDIGFRPPEGNQAKAGTVYRGAFTRVDGTNLAAVHKSMGLDGPTPYALDLTQGRVDRIVGAIHFEAENGGVSGTLKGGEMPLWPPKRWNAVGRRPFGVPLRLHQANPRWVAGLWRADDGQIEDFGILDGVALGTMLVDKDTDFYFGNLLTATSPDLNLAFCSAWTEYGTRIEVNNPTDNPISATVSTPPAITDRVAINQKVTIPAGTTLYIGVRRPRSAR